MTESTVESVQAEEMRHRLYQLVAAGRGGVIEEVCRDSVNTRGIRVVVYRWLGFHVWAVRHACGMSAADVGKLLGVPATNVPVWERTPFDRGPASRYHPALTTLVERMGPAGRSRLEGLLREVRKALRELMADEAYIRSCWKPLLPAPAQWWATRRISADLFVQHDVQGLLRFLHNNGVGHRALADACGVSQSHVWNILTHGRDFHYGQLSRICEGLGIPRGWMGLAYQWDVAPLIPATAHAKVASDHNDSAARWDIPASPVDGLPDEGQDDDDNQQ